MKTLPCDCPYCGKTNTFNVEESIEEVDAKWFQCSCCWKRPTKGEWLTSKKVDVRLSPEDSWVNKYTDVKLPHDSVLKDPDKLAQLSGPVKVRYAKCCNNPKTIHTQEGLLHVCIGQYCDNCGFYWMANTGWTLGDSIQLWREVNNDDPVQDDDSRTSCPD